MAYIIPKVNLNGDRKETLLDELATIRAALEAASRLLRLSSYANGRNYQLNAPGDAQKALDAHSERVLAIDRIAHDLLEIQYEISQQS